MRCCRVVGRNLDLTVATGITLVLVDIVMGMLLTVSDYLVVAVGVKEA